MPGSEAPRKLEHQDVFEQRQEMFEAVLKLKYAGLDEQVAVVRHVMAYNFDDGLELARQFRFGPGIFYDLCSMAGYQHVELLKGVHEFAVDVMVKATNDPAVWSGKGQLNDVFERVGQQVINFSGNVAELEKDVSKGQESLVKIEEAYLARLKKSIPPKIFSAIDAYYSQFYKNYHFEPQEKSKSDNSTTPILPVMQSAERLLTCVQQDRSEPYYVGPVIDLLVEEIIGQDSTFSHVQFEAYLRRGASRFGYKKDEGEKLKRALTKKDGEVDLKRDFLEHFLSRHNTSSKKACEILFSRNILSKEELAVVLEAFPRLAEAFGTSDSLEKKRLDRARYRFYKDTWHSEIAGVRSELLEQIKASLTLRNLNPDDFEIAINPETDKYEVKRIKGESEPGKEAVTDLKEFFKLDKWGKSEIDFGPRDFDREGQIMAIDDEGDVVITSKENEFIVCPMFGGGQERRFKTTTGLRVWGLESCGSQKFCSVTSSRANGAQFIVFDSQGNLSSGYFLDRIESEILKSKDKVYIMAKEGDNEKWQFYGYDGVILKPVPEYGQYGIDDIMLGSVGDLQCTEDGRIFFRKKDDQKITGYGWYCAHDGQVEDLATNDDYRLEVRGNEVVVYQASSDETFMKVYQVKLNDVGRHIYGGPLVYRNLNPKFKTELLLDGEDDVQCLQIDTDNKTENFVGSDVGKYAVGSIEPYKDKDGEHCFIGFDVDIDCWMLNTPGGVQPLLKEPGIVIPRIFGPKSVVVSVGGNENIFFVYAFDRSGRPSKKTEAFTVIFNEKGEELGRIPDLYVDQVEVKGGGITVSGYMGNKRTTYYRKLADSKLDVEPKEHHTTATEQRELDLLTILGKPASDLPSFQDIKEYFKTYYPKMFAPSEEEDEDFYLEKISQVLSQSLVVANNATRALHASQSPRELFPLLPAVRDDLSSGHVERVAEILFPGLKDLQVGWWEGLKKRLAGSQTESENREATATSFLSPRENMQIVDGDPLQENAEEIMSCREPIDGLVVSQVLSAYQKDRAEWRTVQFSVAPELAESIHEYTFTVPVPPGAKEINLPCLAGAEIIVERIKTIDKAGVEKTAKVTANALGQVKVEVKSGDTQIVFSARRSELSTKLDDVTPDEYEKFKKIFGKMNSPELQEKIAKLPAEFLVFLKSLETLPPREKVAAIQNFVKRIGFYDFANKEVQGLRWGKNIEDKLVLMKARWEELSARGGSALGGKAKSTAAAGMAGKQYAGVCADFAEITAALLREAGFLSGILSGAKLHQGKTTTKDCHSVAFVLWPDEKTGKAKIIPIDATPGAVAEGKEAKLLDSMALPSIEEAEVDRRAEEEVALQTAKMGLEVALMSIKNRDLAAIGRMANGELENFVNIILHYGVNESHLRDLTQVFNAVRYSGIDFGSPAGKAQLLKEMDLVLIDKDTTSKKPAGSEFMSLIEEFARRYAKDFGGDKEKALQLLREVVELGSARLEEMEAKAALAVIQYLQAKDMLGKK